MEFIKLMKWINTWLRLFVYANKSATQSDEADVLANQTKYNESIDKIDYAIWDANQVYNLSQKTYQNANGPYKDFLVVYRKRQKVWIELLNLGRVGYNIFSQETYLRELN